MTTLIDTNVIIALLDEEDRHNEWATNAFNNAKDQGPVLISDVVYAEASIAFDSVEGFEEVIQQLGLEKIRSQYSALFSAGKAFRQYRETHRGKPKNNVLPDYFIGADADSLGVPLMTANSADFRTYFGAVELISPDH